VGKGASGEGLPQSPDFGAQRRMSVLSLGSCTVSAASLADTHLTWRSPLSGPLLALPQHPERVHLDLAVDDAAVLKALLIGKRSDGAAVYHALDAGLFERFARNDAAPGLSAASPSE
jgi:hypothetical protein